MHWEGYSITSAVFLPKLCNLNFIVRKHEKSPNWGTFLKTNDLYSSKRVKPWTRNNEELLQIQGTLEIWQLNAMYGPGLDLGLGKKCLLLLSGTIGEIWIRAVDYSTILISWFWDLYCDKKMSLFLANTWKHLGLKEY